jgi:hypothetical protein
MTTSVDAVGKQLDGPSRLMADVMESVRGAWCKDVRWKLKWKEELKKGGKSAEVKITAEVPSFDFRQWQWQLVRTDQLLALAHTSCAQNKA